MGGLLARVYLARYRPQRLGHVVMLGTPNGGSEIADRLKDWPAYRLYFGPAGQQLVTARDAATEALLPAVDYPVGIIAGDRSLDPIASNFMLPGPDDGRVTVTRTKLDGMADHITIPASHAFMIKNKGAIAQTIAFLKNGRFGR
jgi:pimeloyl-ACP methyl ester carboxylesterase